jgi:tetratricopeptide (TPR) repeat protein
LETFLRVYSRDKTAKSKIRCSWRRRSFRCSSKDSANNELATLGGWCGMVHAASGRLRRHTKPQRNPFSYAHLAGNERFTAKVAGTLGSIALYGPTPVVDAIAQCEDAIQRGLSDRQVEASLLCMLASLRAMNGELPVARSLYQRGREMLQDLGQGVRVAASGIDLGNVELHGGDLAAAEAQLRIDVEMLDQMGERYHLPAVAALLAKIIRDQGRDDESLAFLDKAELLTSPSDVSSLAFGRAVRAPVIARQGRLEEAERLAREAVELLGKTESIGLEADALGELAAVLAVGGKLEEAREVVDRAIALYRAKGNSVALARAIAMRESI